ncbi:Phospholipase D/Transphosphatidylase [Methylophaga frappieri]|uniref:Phospholipase D/Transphosphatidylase n=1 Tax=Methylophaga frappieri (strain ATCC BAA-2434 / DSM 25690 / JAM7) TaxID=754477 RepID=I1YJW8_METFJ|nr:VTT domain-containing protein [Methylophaga frappieri]AFJ03211.1 Phospholipase D/Transphosphatidylase [Methylophaga frappieri]
MTNPMRIPVPGKNCWQYVSANRASLLIDGENYFPALHQAITNAKRRIIIVGWDIDSRMLLRRGQDLPDDLPNELGHILCYALQQTPSLDVYILNWDWAMMYTFEREWLPTYRPLWRHQDRLHFELDGECPQTASQHQKIVVIDDQLAFCGGFDLGKHRWDSRDHAAEDSRRQDPDKQAYPPFHDVQWLVDGEAACALSDLARERWFRATEQTLTPIPGGEDVWPNSVSPDFEQVDLAIARTQPAYGGYPEVREVERLYLDSIASAESLIYIENQYFTSSVITDALAKRLAEPAGPEIIIVLPKMTGGWLEQNTMDVLRARLMRRLCEADKHQRLRVCYPHRDALGDRYISVHSKTMIIDDHWLRVGSSNLSNRSMGLDSECDIGLQATNQRQTQKIANIRHDLLAEHMGMSIADVIEGIKQHGSVRHFIDAHQDAAHTLRALDCQVTELSDELLPDSSVIDPEKPLQADDMAKLLLPIQQRSAFRKQWLTGVGIILFICLITLLWQFTPLAEWFSEENLESAGQTIKSLPFAPILLLLVFAISSLFGVPVTLLIIATVMTFGAIQGGIYALIGAVMGAVLGFLCGQRLGKGALARLAGSQVNRISKRLAKRGLLTIITVRIVPVAPFTVINLVAGASHIRLRDFCWGTVLGMLPAILAFTVFTDSLIAALKQPDASQIGVLLGVIVAVIVLSAGLQKLFLRRDAKRPQS